MTSREQLADKLDDMHITPLSHEMAVENSRLVGQAADELRKVCRTCKHFERNDDIDEMLCHVEIQPNSLIGGHRWVPQDGSGFCHHWTPRTAAPEGE